MGAIYIGQPAIDRTGADAGTTFTIIQDALAAGAAGTITQIESYWITAPAGDLYVGVFYSTGGNDRKCRSAANLGHPSVGYNKTTGLSLAVEIGDVLGYYYSGHAIDSDPGGNCRRLDGNHCVVNDEGTYPLWDFKDLSIYGTGAEPEEVGINPGGLVAKMIAGRII